MPRTYKSKDKHTKPSLAGEQNMSEKYLSKNKAKEDNRVGDLIPLLDISIERIKRGSAWTFEELAVEGRKYFEYCEERQLKPNKVGLQMWLGVSKQQYFDWLSNRDRYGEISDLITQLDRGVENQYIERLESYPTGNMFLLKSLHGYKDTQEININTKVLRR